MKLRGSNSITQRPLNLPSIEGGVPFLKQKSNHLAVAVRFTCAVLVYHGIQVLPGKYKENFNENIFARRVASSHFV
jgi:hypothetical protein